MLIDQRQRRPLPQTRRGRAQFHLGTFSGLPPDGWRCGNRTCCRIGWTCEDAILIDARRRGRAKTKGVDASTRPDQRTRALSTLPPSTFGPCDSLRPPNIIADPTMDASASRGDGV